MWFLLLMLFLGVYMQSLIMHMQIAAEQTGAYNVVCVLAVGCTIL